jgi:hypothetical protein
MGYRPPKGVRPPQLEGKRTGRPKGLRNYAAAWAEIQWAYMHRFDDHVSPPTPSARMWWYFAGMYPDEVEDFLIEAGQFTADLV